ncbi:unnamed protein product (macronuclear) [Paramecium tetraurelia]|uniref:Trichohyalin-plectin-homology domain-containing protein n=1 Tax=Paramecium tetraurelia TaxID=5888 RepID=A0D0G1_PARTE|nr:uncharacterized protein GSPATT00012080001 [Paramecium tetraurelia]CAK76528.1 unnamed protein product [Paramecium tetraurelia]|eukprot:XP_001443925.1 hypothetical protein (macronuclear) [Paramecium tetraurelia strain d4-2]
MQRSQNDDDKPLIPLSQATEQKRQEKLAYEKQMARVTLLKQTQQKNLHLAKLYEMAADKIENGLSVKQQLRNLAEEARQLKEEDMNKRKHQIKQIKRHEEEFILKRVAKQKIGDSMKQSQVKEYKSAIKLTISRTRDCILQENQKIRETLYQEEKRRKERKEEAKKLDEMKSQQFYKERVSYEKMIEEMLKKSREKLFQDEQMLQGRLKVRISVYCYQETQNLLSKSQKKFMKLQSQSVHSKR